MAEDPASPGVVITLLVGTAIHSSTGLFNALIYLRPTYMTLRNKTTFARRLTKWQAFWYSILDKQDEQIRQELALQDARRQRPETEPDRNEAENDEEVPKSDDIPSEAP